jgi:hypothetical protein
MEIYKVCILDNVGKPSKIYVFTGNDVQNVENPKIFNDMEREYILSEKIEPIFITSQIHKDDTIRIIKKKILQAINSSVSYEELYLFSSILRRESPSKIFENIYKYGREYIDPKKFSQLLVNLGVQNPEVPEKNEYYYEDFLAYMDKLHPFIKTSLGIRFSNVKDETFSMNPFDLMKGYIYQGTSENAIISFENSQLMSFTSGYKLLENTIYVSYAEDIFDFLERNENNVTEVFQYYFPILSKNGIFSKTELLNERPEMLKNTKKMMDKKVFQLYENIDVLYDIFVERTNELPYIEKGIKKVELCIHPNEKQMLPLDAIFKNVHSSQTVPFIKYNPGPRRENIYRLFSTQINKYGNKVPFLKSSKIIKLSKDVGKNRGISFYIPYSDNGSLIDIILSLSHNSNIYIETVFEKAKTMNEINTIMKTYVNPVIQNMNVFLSRTGYQLNVFDNLYSDFIEISNIKYVCRVPITHKFGVLKEGYISALFEIIEDNVSKGAVLKYKRVENYEEMSPEESFILDWFNSNNAQWKMNLEELFSSLMDFSNINRDQAMMKVNAFLTHHNKSNGKYVNSSNHIMENSGFLTKFSILVEDDSFYAEVENINSIHYVYLIDMYLDSIIRLKQYPETINNIEEERIKMASKQMKDIKAIDKPHIQNVIVPAVEEAKKVMPLRFGKMEEEQEEEEEGGIIFDEYEEDEYSETPNKEQDDSDFITHLDDYQDAKLDDYEVINDNEIISPVSNEASKDIDEPTNYESHSEKSDSSPQGMVFDYDGEETEGGGDTPPVSSSQQNEKYEKQLDGMALREGNTNIFLKRLIQKEPTLYLTSDQGKYERYSRLCQSKNQPVIITNEEKANIDKNHNGSYTNALQYGTDPNNKYWYICPKYWCLKTNTSITEEQVKSGMCGKIIPKGEKTVPPGAYVYEFGDEFNAPGFLTKNNLHPDGYCLPCCFKEWDKKQQKEMRNKCIKGAPAKESNTGMKNITILKIEAVPIEQNRMGFLPFSVQRFLQINNSDAVDPQNPSLLKSDGETLLRYGVEQDNQRSFIGCIASLYSIKKSIVPPISIVEMCRVIRSAVSLDLFVKVHNGSLPSVFKGKSRINETGFEYSEEIRETVFFKSINLSNDSQKDFLDETIVSYNTFLDFLVAKDSLIDYTYLWDIICLPNPKLFEVGLNLAILDVTENDSTDNIELICPSSAYSRIYYDSKKETFILLKNGEIFEPIYLCNMKEKTPTFFEYTVSESLKNVLQIIRNTSQNYCAPLSSIRTYEFKRNKLAEEVRLNILKLKYSILCQVQNFQGKIIGFQIQMDEYTVFIPCLPSAVLGDIPIKFIEDDGLWNDYVLTRDLLTRIHSESNGAILAKPRMKVMEDGLIVGIITETNQFIEINPPSENIHEDSLIVMNGTNYIVADKAIYSGKEDGERTNMMKRISLESQFYSVFRSFIRILLNDYENRELKKQIMEYIENPKYSTKFRLKKVEKLIRQLSRAFIEFYEYSEETIHSLHEISNCQDESDNLKKYCLSRDGHRILLIPKNHLISGANNEVIYYSRISDEIVRYKRIQSFLLQPKMVLNISHSDYKINENEMIMLQSLLTKDYFANLVPFSKKIKQMQLNITYEQAHPRISQKYAHQVDYASQIKGIDNPVSSASEFDIMCIKEVKTEVVGNQTNFWKRMFPKTLQEIVFNESRECSFYPMIYILREKYKTEFSINQVKESLINCYKKYISNSSFLKKIINILEHQGHILKHQGHILKHQVKKQLMHLVKTGRNTLEEVILSEGYYLTNLDLWVLCYEFKLPVVLFSSNNLKNLLDNQKWIVLGGLESKYTEQFYFIRAYTEPLDEDKFNKYHLISPSLKFSEIKGFQNMVDLGKNGHPEYSKNVQSLKTFLENYTMKK